MRLLALTLVTAVVGCSGRSSDGVGTDAGHGHDGSSPDTGTTDAGAMDGGAVDASHVDGSAVDGGAMDAGHDGGATDAGHVTDLGSTDGARPDMDCSTVDCRPIPPGCLPVADGTCCGTFTCPDAGARDAGAGCTPVICPAPRPGCVVDPCTCAETCSADCFTTGCPVGTTCRYCGLPGPGRTPTCWPDDEICPL